MAEPGTRTTAAPSQGDERPWVPVVLAAVAITAFVAGWRCGRGWGRLTGW